MGRFNENPAWKEFFRWLAAAGLGMYVAFSLYAVFIFAEPFAMAVVQTSGFNISLGVVAWLFRLAVVLNLIGVLWLCLRLISLQEGDWPN
jgi:hypothetical protein